MWKSEHQILLLYTGTLIAKETTLCIVSRHCLNEYAYTYRTSTWTYCTPVNIKDEISARQCSRPFMILKSKEGWSGKRYQSKTSHLIMWNLQHPTQPKPTRQRRKKESALAWVFLETYASRRGTRKTQWRRGRWRPRAGRSRPGPRACWHWGTAWGRDTQIRQRGLDKKQQEQPLLKPSPPLVSQFPAMLRMRKKH